MTQGQSVLTYNQQRKQLGFDSPEDVGDVVLLELAPPESPPLRLVVDPHLGLSWGSWRSSWCSWLARSCGRLRLRGSGDSWTPTLEMKMERLNLKG